jgi:uncharacterized protein YebE (UPF0316 family)
VHFAVNNVEAGMLFLGFTSVDLYTWLIIPLLIFLARIVDVSIGTIRILFISRGKKYLAPIMGFCEVLIWLLAIGQIMRNLTNVFCYVAYAGGFATGTYVGLWIEEKLAVGLLMVRVVSHRDASPLIEHLQKEQFGVTHVAARGVTGKVRIVFTIIKRSDLSKVIEIIRRFNPNAFYSTEDVRSVSKEVFPLARFHYRRSLLGSLLGWRKGK